MSALWKCVEVICLICKGCYVYTLSSYHIFSLFPFFSCVVATFMCVYECFRRCQPFFTTLRIITKRRYNDTISSTISYSFNVFHKGEKKTKKKKKFFFHIRTNKNIFRNMKRTKSKQIRSNAREIEREKDYESMQSNEKSRQHIHISIYDFS